MGFYSTPAIPPSVYARGCTKTALVALMSHQNNYKIMSACKIYIVYLWQIFSSGIFTHNFGQMLKFKIWTHNRCSKPRRFFAAAPSALYMFRNQDQVQRFFKTYKLTQRNQRLATFAVLQIYLLHPYLPGLRSNKYGQKYLQKLF